MLAAWPLVHRRCPGAELMIVGVGGLASLARSFAEDRAEVDLAVDPPRAQVHRELRRAAVLVLLSRPTPTWREQVGLPVVEALAHGCAVVTTEQSGLAGWLSEHGHHVISSAATDAEVARAVITALDRRPAGGRGGG